jgi:hypothetical protein
MRTNHQAAASSSAGKAEKEDFSTAIMERKKAPNRLVVDEATADDNSVMSLHPGESLNVMCTLCWIVWLWQALFFCFFLKYPISLS